MPVGERCAELCESESQFRAERRGTEFVEDLEVVAVHHFVDKTSHERFVIAHAIVGESAELRCAASSAAPA
jgi:hypothetical protein